MNIYALITPLVLILLLVEVVVCLWKRNDYYSFQDTISNLGTGIGNQCVNLAVAFFVYKFYTWVNQFAPYHFEATGYNYALLLVLSDFVFYWFHRTGHTFRLFWAAHSPHHSSEEMNLSVGLRASFTQRLFQFLFFDWILALMGFSAEMIYQVAAVHLFLAYWHHTRLIRSMGWFEKLFVSPTHHRVHHGVNNQYLDKNYSEFLIIWDKIFGTYEPEDEPICYGLTTPPKNWDPIYINLQYWRHLWYESVTAPTLWDSIRIWFMRLDYQPHWLPAPTGSLGYNLDKQQKYQSTSFSKSKGYLIFQVIVGLVYMYFAINQQMPFAAWERGLMTVCIFIMIASWSAILQSKPYALLLEIGRLLAMSVSFVWILHSHEIIHWTNWVSSLTFLVAGGSILWASFYFKRCETTIAAR